MIAVVGLPNTKNLGDPILFENTEELIRSIVPEQELLPIDVEFKDAPAVQRLSYRITRKISGILTGKNSKAYWRILIRAQKLFLKNYYRKRLNGADAVIFAGGGIFKYRYEEVGIRASLIVEIASTQDIPVMFNSIGIEGYDAQHPQARYLKEAANNNVVKVITTRDDLATLRKDYITNSNIKTAWTPDSAWWSDVTYRHGEPSDAQNPVIGLGMIRKGIFVDNNLPLSDEELFSFWKSICVELTKRGLAFEFFTNGVQDDGIFITEFIERFPEYRGILVCVPADPAELISTISRYSRILASRMHTSIISYALNVPTLSILWNNKIKMFYEQIHHSDRVIDVQSMRGNHVGQIVNQLESISYDENDLHYKQSQRNLTQKYLQEFITNYVKPRITQREA
jgi:polysaccharide pyruvyl transferase WcaK-like protein